ncbi:MAG: hypothetical protein V4490_05810 [Pseudomonadota bacterium]
MLPIIISEMVSFFSGILTRYSEKNKLSIFSFFIAFFTLMELGVIAVYLFVFHGTTAQEFIYGVKLSFLAATFMSFVYYLTIRYKALKEIHIKKSAAESSKMVE